MSHVERGMPDSWLSSLPQDVGNMILLTLSVTELLRARTVCKEWRGRIDQCSKLLLKPAIVREFGPWQVYMEAGSWTSHNWKATYTRAYAIGASHKLKQVTSSLERLRSEMQLLQSCAHYYSCRSDLCRQELAGHQRDLNKASKARQPKSQDAAAQHQQRRSDLQQVRDTAARKLQESTAQAAQQQQNVARRQCVLAQLQQLQQHLQAQIAKLKSSVPWAFEVQREPYMPSYVFGPDPTVLAALAASNYGNGGRGGASGGGNSAASVTSSSGSAASAGGS